MEEIEEIVALVSQLWYAEDGKWLNTRRTVALRGALLGKTNSEIGEEHGYSPNSVKDAGQAVFGMLTRRLGTKVTKANSRSVLRAYVGTLRQLTAGAENSPSVSSPSISTPSVASGLVPVSVDRPHPEVTARLIDTNILDNRSQDLEQLKNLLCQERGSIVVLGGLSQTGKSPLVAALIEEVREEFDAVALLDAYDVPTVAQLAARLSGEDDVSGPEVLLERLFHERKPLVILERFDSLFRPVGLSGMLQETSACYERWLPQLANNHLTGSLILITRVMPQILCQPGAMRLGTETVKLYPLRGWPSPLDRQWLERHGVAAQSEAEWQALLSFCGGYPELLDSAADLILNDHQNDVATFLDSPMRALRQVRQTLQLELAQEELALIPWLMLRPLSYGDLQRLWIRRLTEGQQAAALESLERRSFVMKGDDGAYCLHPLALLCCVADLWVERLINELQGGELDWLHWYPLILVDAPEWLQQRHHEYILLPLLTQLSRIYLSEAEQRSLIEQSIATVRQSSYGQGTVGQGDYAMGNLLNIAIAWQLPLHSIDIAGTRLQHVDLRCANIDGLGAQDCTFVRSAFPVPLMAPLRGVMTETGDCLVIGDGNGRLVWWRGVAPDMELSGCYKFDGAIDAVAVSDGVMAVATGQTVVVLWPSSDADPYAVHTGMPPWQLEVSATVTCLAFDPDAGQLAAGLESGQVIAWNLFDEEESFAEPSHNHMVCRLIFNADGTQLASYGSGNRIRRHALLPDGNYDVTIPLEADFGGSFIGIGWHEDQLCGIERMSRTNSVFWRNRQNRMSLETNAYWDLAVFSGDGGTIAGYDINGLVLLYQVAAPETCIRSMPVAQMLNGQMPVGMQLNVNGDLLLLCSPDHVQLWETTTGYCLWQCQTTRQEYSRATGDWSGATGIPDWHQELLRAIGISL